MAFVITQNCCTDASCVPVCPVDCIRPVPDGSSAPMLYIDPETCVDCGACMAECPVDAIYYEDDLPAAQARFRDINAGYFKRLPLQVREQVAKPQQSVVDAGALRVAIVGTGPAACYAASELLHTAGIEINMFDRLPTPFGLIRSGVAPDHQATKQITSVFEPVLSSRQVSCHLNVEVGRDVTHAELAAHHDAVIYAVGAAHSRALGIPGEMLAGHHPAADFVAWYNGHPDHADRQFNLDTPRVVIIGNGNVALDAARVLVAGNDYLSRTDIAEHALRALGTGSVQDVVLLGRRGPADGAFSVGELIALGELAGVDVAVEGELGPRPDDNPDGELKYDLVAEYAARPANPGNRRIVLRFSSAPVKILGTERVEGLRHSAGSIDTGLILRSIGYRGAPIPGLPFDEASGRVPNQAGRVVDGVGTVPGVYVTGWIKRGPQGIIGTNRTCAQETVASLIDDFANGRLHRTADDDIAAILASRGVKSVGWQGWLSIDEAERARGVELRRPRVKLVSTADLVAVARA